MKARGEPVEGGSAADEFVDLRRRVRELRWLVRLLMVAVLFASGVFVYYGVLRETEAPVAPQPQGVALEGATVQVLNGADTRAPLAGALVERLEAEGIAGDVLPPANAVVRRQERTLILLHGASRDAGLQLAEWIGLTEQRVLVGTPAPANGDVTILLGADHAP